MNTFENVNRNPSEDPYGGTYTDVLEVFRPTLAGAWDPAAIWAMALATKPN